VYVGVLAALAEARLAAWDRENPSGMDVTNA
jgi:hypothetical protein